MKNKSHYDDISQWQDGVALFVERLKQWEQERKPLVARRERLAGVSPLKAYALLIEFIAPRPNGFMTFIGREQKPGDNLVWWDFLMRSPQHLVSVMSGVDGLIADVHVAPEEFSAERFLSRNCERHRARIEKRIRTFERHEVYANQYYSYRRTAEWLKTELAMTSDTVPSFRGGLREDDAASAQELEDVKAYSAVAVQFHVLAKSLVINSAFVCEALVSTLLRVGALRHLLRQPESLRPLLRAPFMQRVEVLHAYTVLFERPLDLGAGPVKEVRALMETRNKLVHAEQSEHSRLDDVFFDGDFPLYGAGSHGQIAEFYRRTFLTPSKSDALDAIAVANSFEKFVLENVRKELRNEVKLFLEQPQLGYNTVKALYSVPFPVTVVQTFMLAQNGAVPTSAAPAIDLDPCAPAKESGRTDGVAEHSKHAVIGEPGEHK